MPGGTVGAYQPGNYFNSSQRVEGHRDTERVVSSALEGNPRVGAFGESLPGKKMHFENVSVLAFSYEGEHGIDSNRTPNKGGQREDDNERAEAVKNNRLKKPVSGKAFHVEGQQNEAPETDCRDQHCREEKSDAHRWVRGFGAFVFCGLTGFFVFYLFRLQVLPGAIFENDVTGLAAMLVLWIIGCEFFRHSALVLIHFGLFPRVRGLVYALFLFPVLLWPFAVCAVLGHWLVLVALTLICGIVIFVFYSVLDLIPPDL